MGSVSPGARRESIGWCGFGECPSPDNVRTELHKVLASASFRTSPALRRFLRYSVEHSLEGEGDLLKEYRLGVEVFGRSPSYEPQKDPIVRLEARRLRAKLREYYEDEGRHDPVRISVPKGRYSASFSGNGHTELSAALPDRQSASATEAARFLSRNAKIQIAVVILIVVVLLVGWVLKSGRGQSARATSVAVSPFDNLSDVGRHLQSRLTGQQTAQLLKPQTEISEAYQLYLRGRYEWNKRTEEGLTKAVEYFSRAIDKDPRYALAYAGQADGYVLLAEYTVLPSKEALPKAEEAAEKALELDETVAEAHASLGAVRADYEWDWQDAEKEFRRAIELNPGYATAHQWYAELLSQQGRHDEAITEIQRALELDPLSLVINAIAGRIYLFAGRVDSAIAQLQRTLDIDPNFSLANYDLGKSYLQKGMINRAIAEFQKSVNLFRVSERDAALAYAYARSGNRREARNVLQTYLRQSHQAYVSWYGLAFIYAGLGEKDEAFTCLAKAYEQRDVRLRDLNMEPMFESLHPDPRFTRLARSIGLP